MAAKVCQECGGLVASSLSVCPHCGHPVDGSMNTGQPYGNTSGYGNAGQQPCGSVNPYNSIGWPIVALLLFWPCAIASFIYYSRSDEEWRRGNVANAQHYGELSKKWGKATIWICIIPIILLVLIALLALASEL